MVNGGSRMSIYDGRRGKKPKRLAVASCVYMYIEKRKEKKVWLFDGTGG